MTNEQTTGDDGKATFQLEYGDYVATITKDGYVTKTENIAFRSNHKNFSITLEDSVQTGVVSVTCLNDEQAPVEDIGVALCSELVPFNSIVYDWDNIVAMGTTGSDGVVTLKALDPSTHLPTETDAEVEYGNYYLYANGDTGYNGVLTVDSAEVNVSLQLQPQANISVLDNANDNGISSAIVTATLDDGDTVPYTNIADETGACTIYMPFTTGGVLYDMTATADGYEQTSDPNSFDFNEPYQTQNIYMNEATVPFYFKVVDNDTNNPIQNAQVLVGESEEPPVTDVNGLATAQVLMSQTYYPITSANGYYQNDDLEGFNEQTIREWVEDGYNENNPFIIHLTITSE